MQEIIYFIYIIGYVCTALQNNYSTCFQKSVYLELYIFSSYVTYLVFFLPQTHVRTCLSMVVYGDTSVIRMMMLDVMAYVLMLA